MRHVLCASDVEPYRLAELLALADDDCRRRWESLEPRLHRIAGLPALRDEIATLYAWLDPPTTSSPSPARRKACSSRCTRCSARAITRSSHGRPTSRCTKWRDRSAPTVTLVPLNPRDWSLDVGRRRRRDAAEHARHRRQLAAQPDRRAALAGATCSRLLAIAELHGAHLFSDEVYRFLEHGAPPPPAGRERSRPRRQPWRHVEGVRAGRIAHRLDRDARSVAPRPTRGAQGLHDDLQRAPSEILVAHRAPRPRAGARAIARNHRDESGRAR